MGFFSFVGSFFEKSPIEKHDDDMRNLADPMYHKCRFCARCDYEDGKFYCNNEGNWNEIEREKLGEYGYPDCGTHYFIPYMDGCNRVTRGATDQENLDKILEEAKRQGFYPRGKWDEYLY